MPDLPRRKVGVVACSGEELAEGTVTRQAALSVLEHLRPADTVTICLPLFLAGGEGDRAFARFYPTIAVDGCEKRCAARATELYSGPPAASVVVSDVMREEGLTLTDGPRRLGPQGVQAVEATAGRVASLVDSLLGDRRDRPGGPPAETIAPAPIGQGTEAVCACASAIPVEVVDVAGRPVPLVALSLIFAQYRDAGRAPGADATRELLATVKIYNQLPAEIDEELAAALAREYAAFCAAEGARR
jgi:uncharacterized metal-binding protein